MKKEMLRRGSSGLLGTYNNIEHHAEGVKPLVDYLVGRVDSMPWVKWRQGVNVHLLVRSDGLVLELRPFRSKRGRWGIEVRLRVSKKVRPVLFVFRSIRQKELIGSFIEFLGQAPPENYYCKQD